MQSNYQWKIKSFGKKIDPDQALEEIRKAENLYGKITAETVLKVAEDDDSPIHELFEWDDSKAAHNYRLAQARTIINNLEVIVISSSEKEIRIPVFEITKDESEPGRQYKHIDVLTSDDRDYIVQTTIKHIRQLQTKLSAYKDFDSAIKHLQSAETELELFNEK